MKARIAWTAALIALASIPLVSIAVLSWRSQSPGDGIHPGFTQAFVDLNRRMDDDATAVAYDPALGILAVGRDSGRLELWDVSRTEARIVRKAHSYRIEHLAFGARDGIVLSSSVGSNTTGVDPHGVPKVWDARTGTLLLALPGDWLGGPLAAAPVPGFYLLSSYDELRIYDHARRAIVGEPLRVEGGITALGSDMASALVAVGSGNGGLLLLEWQDEGGIPRLELASRNATSGNEPRTDVLAVMLRDEGRRLVSVHWPPKAVRHDHPPQIAGEQAEVVQWDTMDWRRERAFPISLQTVHWASYTPGQPWLVLAGNESTRGRIELVDLENGIAWRYRANTTHPVAVLLPEARTGLVMQAGGATRIRYLDQE